MHRTLFRSAAVLAHLALLAGCASDDASASHDELGGASATGGSGAGGASGSGGGPGTGGDIVTGGGAATGGAATGGAATGGTATGGVATGGAATGGAATGGAATGGAATGGAATGGAATGGLALPRIPWEGGPAYWAAYPKANAAGWTNPSFFPISVFFGKPEHAPALADIGVNVYQGAEHDGSAISTMTANGIYVLAQSEWTPSEVGDDPRVVGWHVSDECDMGYSGCTPDWGNDNGEYGRLEIQQGYVDELRALDDGRFLQANFGNGVLRTFWAPNTMEDHVRLMDVASVDKYAYTSPHVQDLLPSSPDWPAGATAAASGSYGWLAEQMRSFQDPSSLRPYWVFVESAMPYLTEEGATTITVEQFEGAIWSALIHEARGIALFQHNNGDVCGNYSLVDCDADRLAQIRDVLTAVHALAPVLNTQSYAWDFASGTDTMLKATQGSAWILAGIGLSQTPGTKTFTLPPGITGTTVEVVGEGRTLPVSAGAFSDTFPRESTHHTYRIAL